MKMHREVSRTPVNAQNNWGHMVVNECKAHRETIHELQKTVGVLGRMLEKERAINKELKEKIRKLKVRFEAANQRAVGK